MADDNVLTLEKVFDTMDKKYYLTYVDYRDSLDDSLESIQKCINEQCMDSLYEKTDEWFNDQEWDSISEITKELEANLEEEFGEEQVDAFFYEKEDWIRDEIYNRNNSTPFDDLLRNTSDPIMFYDLCVDIDECGYDSHMVEDNIRVIKKALGIPQKNKEYDRQLDIMIQQASYGGRLVIYFRGDIKEMINSSQYNTIQFANPMIAVIDTYNGSGDNTDIQGITVTLPYNPENVFLDKLIKYNYTYEVCGMIESWCDTTCVKFISKKYRKPKEQKQSGLYAEIEQDEKYKATYKAGKCTFGDMDYNRHRNKKYINEYPCGTHCMDCGTFWID